MCVSHPLSYFTYFQTMTETTTLDKFEELLGNNRTPKISELRAGLLANYGMGGKHREDAGKYVSTRLSGKTLARLAFADSRTLYRDDPACEVRPRPPGMAVEGGGLVAGAGLYAVRALVPGEIITEFEINAHITAVATTEIAPQLYLDPRIGAVDTTTLSHRRLQDESLSVNIGTHSTAFCIPLSLRTTPYKLMAFANDSIPYPPEKVTDRSTAVTTYVEQGGALANACSESVYGFIVHLVATKHIAADDEVLYHWGASHWDELYRLRDKGMRLRLHEVEGDQDQPAPDQPVALRAATTVLS
jgi:hypothetical protein